MDVSAVRRSGTWEGSEVLLEKTGLLLLEKKELHEYTKGLLEKKRKLIEKRDLAKVNKHESSKAEIKYALAAARIGDMEEEILRADVAIAGFEESQSADSLDHGYESVLQLPQRLCRGGRSQIR